VTDPLDPAAPPPDPAGSDPGSGRRFTAAWARDAAERVIATAIIVGAGALAGNLAADAANWQDAGREAARAAGIAAFQLIKVLVAGLVGQPTSASMLAADAGPISPPPVPLR
jgi:hypothetical protein